MSDKEQIYDEIIAPQLKRIAQACVDNDMPLLFIVEFDKDRVGETRYIGDSNGIKFMSHKLNYRLPIWNKGADDGKGKEV